MSVLSTDDAPGGSSIGFINFAHAIDHYVILIFPTVVIGLEAIYGRSYAELIALGTASFVTFGVFSLPAGWLADRWSRRNMMALFYFGCGVSLVGGGAGAEPDHAGGRARALGMFAAIYHPVGTAMLIEQATDARALARLQRRVRQSRRRVRGRHHRRARVVVGWRGAFMVPAVLCILTGVAYLQLVPGRPRNASASARRRPTCGLPPGWRRPSSACSS